MLSNEDNEALCRVGPGTPMGNLMRQYWMPAAALGRAAVARLPAAARAPAGRGPHRLPHDLRRGRPDAERLPAPRRLDVLRPQRGRGPALRLPRLEVRRRRHLRRHAVGAGRVELQEQGARAGLPVRTSATASSGPTWARARCRRRCPTSRRNMLAEELPASRCCTAPVQLDAGLGGRDRHGPRRLPARRRRPGPKTASPARFGYYQVAAARRASSASATPSSARRYGMYRAGRGRQLLLAHRPHAVPLLRDDRRRRHAGQDASFIGLRADGRLPHAGVGRVLAPHAEPSGGQERARGAAGRCRPRVHRPNGTGWFDRFRIDAEPEATTT